MTSLLDQFRRVGRDLYATGLVSSHGTSILEESAQVLWLLRVLTGER